MTRVTTVYQNGRPIMARLEPAKDGRWTASNETTSAAGDTPEEAADNLSAAISKGAA